MQNRPAGCLLQDGLWVLIGICFQIVIAFETKHSNGSHDMCRMISTIYETVDFATDRSVTGSFATARRKNDAFGLTVGRIRNQTQYGARQAAVRIAEGGWGALSPLGTL